MSTTKIMLIRHAEKPTKTLNGVSPDGSADPEDLIVQGWQRAGALIGLFAPPHGQTCQPGLATPRHLFASGVAKHSESLRPEHTVMPLSAKLGIDIDTQYEKGDETKLASAIQQAGGAVLVAWEHEAIPSIAQAIFPGGPSPDNWPDDRFDLVWVFDRLTENGAWTFLQVPQMLLAGDKASVISTSGNSH